MQVIKIRFKFEILLLRKKILAFNGKMMYRAATSENADCFVVGNLVADLCL